MDALIVVDVQNDFLPGGALAVPKGNEVTAPINRLMRRFDLCVATQDWHPPGHLSFAENHPGRAVFERIELDGLEQVLWPAHCVQGTLGAEFAKELEVRRFAHVTRKGTDPRIDSYSGFFDNGRRKATDLDAYLRSRNVTRVFVCGLALDYCVKFTALDATRLGYRTVVVEDACRAIALDPEDYGRTLDELRTAGVTIATAESLPQC
ncbi:MAG TPA: bifunctional nicotinamidase/pyrazinamidase [Planctomycetaceae bacterium]